MRDATTLMGEEAGPPQLAHSRLHLRDEAAQAGLAREPWWDRRGDRHMTSPVRHPPRVRARRGAEAEDGERVVIPRGEQILTSSNWLRARTPRGGRAPRRRG
jgi:hypothetical protein